MQLHGVMLRRSKDDVLALPPKLRTWLPVAVAPGTGARAIKKVFELLAGKDTRPSAVAGCRVAAARQAARVPGGGAAGARGRQSDLDARFRERRDRAGRESDRLFVLRRSRSEARTRAGLNGGGRHRQDARPDAAAAGGPVPERCGRPCVHRQHHRGWNGTQPDRGDAGGVQRSRLGADQPLAGRGPGVPDRPDSHSQCHVRRRARHDRRLRPGRPRNQVGARQRHRRRRRAGSRIGRRRPRRAAARPALDLRRCGRGARTRR